MLRLRVEPESAAFIELVRCSIDRAIACGHAINDGEIPTLASPVGPPVLDLATVSERSGPSIVESLAVLVAAAGLVLSWEDEVPWYAVGRMDWACATLAEVAASISACTAGEIDVTVRPELDDVAAGVLEACCAAGMQAARADRRGGPSILPGVVELDDQQRAAVNAPLDVALLINAGAGSGKTHTLAFRIAHVVAEGGVSPERCLVLTFSVAARTQIKDRLASLGSQGFGRVSEVEVRTFHSLARRLLLTAAAHGLTRFKRGLTIVETVQVVAGKSAVSVPSVFAECLDALFEGVPDGLTPATRLALYPNAIAALRNGHPIHGLVGSPDELIDQEPVIVTSTRTGQFIELSSACVRTVWERYEAELARRNAVDLGWLVPEALRALRQHPSLLQLVSSTYDYLFVDEYQDTTLAQDELLFLLASAGLQLNVVGDGDQTINTFAGARAGSMVKFSDRVQERLGRTCLVLSLERNYRSRPEIVELATHVIQKNKERLPKTMKAATDAEPESGHVFRVQGEFRYVAPWVALQVSALLDAGEDPSKIAVLYRKEAENSPQKSAVLQHLTSQGVPVSEEEESADGVRILSIHRSKGLEFNRVFTLYLHPGDFPDRRGDIEEERRLLYVALTRARNTVYACGKGGGATDFFLETDVDEALPRLIEVRSLPAVLDAAVAAELSDAFEATVLDWDEPA